jgi:hypothetical protein
MPRRGTISKYTDDHGHQKWRFRVDIAGGRGNRRQVKRQGFDTRTAAGNALDLVLAQHDGVSVRSDPDLVCDGVRAGQGLGRVAWRLRQARDSARE